MKISKNQLRQYILMCGAGLSCFSYYIYETWKASIPPEPIPIQSWNIYVERQKAAVIFFLAYIHYIVWMDMKVRVVDHKDHIYSYDNGRKVRIYVVGMTQTGPFQRVNTVSPPLKGSFPLDHEGACKLEMLKYMCCLHEKNQQNTECRELAQAYFSCRMEKGLMDRDDWHKLGYGDKKNE